MDDLLPEGRQALTWHVFKARAFLSIQSQAGGPDGCGAVPAFVRFDFDQVPDVEIGASMKHSARSVKTIERCQGVVSSGKCTVMFKDPAAIEGVGYGQIESIFRHRVWDHRQSPGISVCSFSLLTEHSLLVCIFLEVVPWMVDYGTTTLMRLKRPPPNSTTKIMEVTEVLTEVVLFLDVIPQTALESTPTMPFT